MYQNKLDTIPAITDVLQNGVLLGSLPDFTGKPIKNYYFGANVRIGDESQMLFMRTRKDEGHPNIFACMKCLPKMK